MCRRYGSLGLLRKLPAPLTPSFDSQLKEQADELDKENGWDLSTQLAALNLEPFKKVPVPVAAPPVAAASSSPYSHLEEADDDADLAEMCRGFDPATTPASEWTWDNIPSYLLLCPEADRRVPSDSMMTPPPLVCLEKYQREAGNLKFRCTFADAQGVRVVFQGIDAIRVFKAYGAQAVKDATLIPEVYKSYCTRPPPMLLAPEETVPLPYPFLPTPDTPKTHAEYPRWAYHNFVVTERDKLTSGTVFTSEHMAEINRRWVDCAA